MTSPTTLEDFEAIELRAEETGIFLRRFGSGPPLLLLHGFPQTHLMWRSVAPLLSVVAPGAARTAARAHPGGCPWSHRRRRARGMGFAGDGVPCGGPGRLCPGATRPSPRPCHL